MFVKPALLAQVERSRVRMPHTLSAPAVDRPQRVAERNLEQQFRLIALHRLVDMGNLIQPLFQMTDVEDDNHAAG